MVALGERWRRAKRLAPIPVVVGLALAASPNQSAALNCVFWSNNQGFMPHNVHFDVVGDCDGWRQHGNYVFTGYAKEYQDPVPYQDCRTNLNTVGINSYSNGNWWEVITLFSGYGWEHQVATPWYSIVASGYQHPNLLDCISYNAI